jgi:hypothetical protein
LKPLLFSLLLVVSAVQCAVQPDVHKEVKLTESEVQLANQLHDVTKEYLDEKLTFFSKGGKPFSKFEVLGIDETNGTVHEYVWYYFREYVARDGHLVDGSGQSLPVALTIERNGDSFKVKAHQAPIAGEVNMFPEKLRGILKEYVPPKEWEAQIKEDAKKYYNID